MSRTPLAWFCCALFALLSSPFASPASAQPPGAGLFTDTRLERVAPTTQPATPGTQPAVAPGFRPVLPTPATRGTPATQPAAAPSPAAIAAAPLPTLHAPPSTLSSTLPLRAKADALRAQIARLQADLDATEQAIAEKDGSGGWVVLFSGTDPAKWTDAAAKAPAGTRYLRMMAGGKAVIIPIAAAQLTARGALVTPRHGWNGTSALSWNARQLGVYRVDAAANRDGEVQVLDAGPGWFKGWGFGVRRGLNDRQGFMWEGQEIAPTPIEIAVRTTALKSTDLPLLLK